MDDLRYEICQGDLSRVGVYDETGALLHSVPVVREGPGWRFVTPVKMQKDWTLWLLV